MHQRSSMKLCLQICELVFVSRIVHLISLLAVYFAISVIYELTVILVAKQLTRNLLILFGYY